MKILELGRASIETKSTRPDSDQPDGVKIDQLPCALPEKLVYGDAALDFFCSID